MSNEYQDDAASNRLGLSLIAAAMSFVLAYNLTQRIFLAMGVAILAFLIAHGRFSALYRHIAARHNNRHAVKPEFRGLEDKSVTTPDAAERYWSSYDAAEIWKQRSEEIETSGQNMTLYGQLRTNIPELSGASLRPEITLAPQKQKARSQ